MTTDKPKIPAGQVVVNMACAMVEAERKAWLSLAGYKFWMFGYHAAQWVLLKSLMPEHHPNPFAALVRFAKDVCKERGFRENDNG